MFICLFINTFDVTAEDDKLVGECFILKDHFHLALRHTCIQQVSILHSVNPVVSENKRNQLLKSLSQYIPKHRQALFTNCEQLSSDQRTFIFC